MVSIFFSDERRWRQIDTVNNTHYWMMAMAQLPPTDMKKKFWAILFNSMPVQRSCVSLANTSSTPSGGQNANFQIIHVFVNYNYCKRIFLLLITKTLLFQIMLQCIVYIKRTFSWLHYLNINYQITIISNTFLRKFMQFWTLSGFSMLESKNQSP